MDAANRLRGSKAVASAWLETEQRLLAQFNVHRLSPVVAILRSSPLEIVAATNRIERLVSMGVQLTMCEWDSGDTTVSDNAVKEWLYLHVAETKTEQHHRLLDCALKS